jgi:uncharacterized protein YdhG (YjbR/CyaY superfamily)
MGTDQPPQDVDAYLSGRPPAVRTRLEALRRIIRETVPEAVEGFAYAMPAYQYKGKPLAYFAGYAAHVGLYALPATHEAFAAELSAYRTGKGSVQFPLDRPLPEALVGRMVAFRKAAIDKDAGGGRAGRVRKTAP